MALRITGKVDIPSDKSVVQTVSIDPGICYHCAQYYWQCLSLDCAIMYLSDQVFCPSMAYVALSCVRCPVGHLTRESEEALDSVLS